MSKLILGLDVGIASVGWGIIDAETYHVVDAGVNIFSERSAAENVNRRLCRGARRLLRRRIHRLYRLKSLLTEYKMIDDSFSPLDNPYEIRVKGLHHKLTNQELATAILSIAKHRGISGITIIETENDNEQDNQSTKKILGATRLALNDHYVCEIQLERFQKTGKVRGIENQFYTDDYLKELNQIFKNQQLPNDLKEKIIAIIKSKREYYDGPGSANSPTPYGRFNMVNGQLIEVSMIDKMRGHCTIYPDQLRAPKMAFSTDLFNFLNDLNNLTIAGNHISEEQKREIIRDFILPKGGITVNKLLKFLGVEEHEVKGFRLNASKKPIITEFEGYKRIIKLVKEHHMNPLLLSPELIDQIIDILTTYKSYEERTSKLKTLSTICLQDFEIDILAHLTKIKGYHSLSFKVIYELIPILLQTDNNQMQIFQMYHYFTNKQVDYHKTNNIPFNNELILSPVAKRAQQEALKIVNMVRKKYGELDSIIIEMAREKNNEEQKENIKKKQKKAEENNHMIKNLIGDLPVSSETKLKLRLYIEQDGKCPYTGKSIDINELIQNPYLFEIDHIIPITISLDDSLSNKVLVFRKANQEKGQKSPYQYFKNKTLDGWNYEDYKSFVKTNENYRQNSKKRYLMLLEEDINRYDVRKSFIARNLVDTRYATRSLLYTIREFYQAKGINTKVHTVKGSFTFVFRQKAQLKKDREENYDHHAIDALIVAGIKKMNFMDHILNTTLHMEDDNLYVFSKDTGELITLQNEDQYYDQQYIQFIKRLRNISVKYSHKIDKKPNRVIADATIYSTREIEGKTFLLRKLKNIYDKDGQKLKEMFAKGKEKNLLIYHHDHESFQQLKKVIEQYPTEKNPFQKFYQDNQQYIYKKNRKGVGIPIISLKYYDGEVDSCLNITHHYPQTHDNKKVILLSKNPYRIDIYQDCGVYKFLKIDHCNLNKNNVGQYMIDQSWYETEKARRNISSKAEFLFSLHKYELVYFKNKNGKEGLVRYIGTNYNYNIIEYKLRERPSMPKERFFLTISKNLLTLEKYSTDILGNIYKCKKMPCKFII